MSKIRRKKTKIKLNNILILLVLLSSIYLIYTITLFNMEDFIRYIFILIIIILNMVFFNFKRKKKGKIRLVLMIVFIIFNILFSIGLKYIYNLVDSINKNKIVYSSSLIALNNSDIKNIDDVTGKRIGLLDDSLSIDNYQIAKEIIDDNKLDKDNKIIMYDDLIIMLKDLYDKKIDTMFVSSNYSVMFQNVEGYENIKNEVYEITYKDKTIKKQKNKFSMRSGNSIKPFSILLMGVDSEKDGLKKNSYANGDGLILMTFNPNTLNLTMMSIPRDSYVPISCKKNTYNKLTHAGWFGTDCMIETIENLFDVDVNYYVKVNFKGVVNLVDNLGGVEIDVPFNLCTDNSNRQGKICINKGYQTLNGEQALVLARNRYDLALGDIQRGYNQQLLIKGLINKVKTIRNVNTLIDVLNTVSNNLDTNLSTSEIMSFYDIFKDILDSNTDTVTNYPLNIIQIKLNGDNSMKYFKNLNSKLFTYELKKDSINEATNEMKINLGIKDAEFIKKITLKP